MQLVPENKILIIKKALKNYVPGEKVRIKVDDNGVPLEPYWRRRIKDAKIDGCVSFAQEQPAEKFPVVAEQEDDND